LPIGGMIIPRRFALSRRWKRNSAAREGLAQTQHDKDDSGMTANRRIAPSLTAVTAVLSVCLYGVVAEPAASEDVGIGPPPALEPGQAPPLPRSGPLAQPRSQYQVGFPSALTASVIPRPARLRPPRSHWARSCSSTVGSQVTAQSPAPRATIRHALSPTAGPRRSASTAVLVSATRQPS
jgi:hypothetical protein